MKKKDIGIILPCYNEASELEENILKLHSYIKKNLNINYKLVIVDNNSTDKTSLIATKLSKKHKEIEYFHIPQKGKGLAVKKATMELDFDWYIMLDSDIPIELKYLKPMMKLIKSSRYDLICGCRHCKKGKLITNTVRKIISFGTTIMVKSVLLNFRIKDTQAGFKAWNKKIKDKVWPLVNDKEFFFDIELIHYSYKKKYNVFYLPITYYIDVKKNGGSKVKLFKDVMSSFIKLIKLRFS